MLAVADLPGDIRGRRERVQRVERLARPMARGAEVEQRLRALGGVIDPQLDRGANARRGLVEGERVRCRPSRAEVVFDRAPGFAEGRGRGEVVCEVRERAPGAL